MRSKLNQDFLSGVMFAATGLLAAWIARDYPMGSPQRPGTGVLPMILAWCLIGTGGLLCFKGFVSGGSSTGQWALRPIIMVTLAVVSFGFLVDNAGLVVAMLVSMTCCALGTPETRWSEYLFFSAVMVAIGVSVFILLLGMPIPIFPAKVPGWLNLFSR